MHLIPQNAGNYEESKQAGGGRVYHAYWPTEHIQMTYDTATDVQEL